MRQGSQSHIEAPGSLRGVLGPPEGRPGTLWSGACGAEGLWWGIPEDVSWSRARSQRDQRLSTQAFNNQVGGWSLRCGIQGTWWQRWGMGGVGRDSKELGSQSESLEISRFLRGLWGVSGGVSMEIALRVGLPGTLCVTLGVCRYRCAAYSWVYP